MIHQNQAEFVRMLNEPITEDSTSAASLLTGGQAPATQPSGAGTGAGAGAGGIPGLGGMGVDPAQVAQMMASLSPEQQAQVAQSVGNSIQ